MPKSSHRKKERPSRAKRRLPAGAKQSKREVIDGLIHQVGEISYTSNADVEQEKKKPRLIALTFCDLVSVDVLGKVNLMGCFDRIFVDKKTNSTGLFYLYVRTAGVIKGHVEITFIDTKNKPIAQASYDVQVPEKEIKTDRPIHVQFHSRVGFGTKERGVFWVDVTVDGESLGGRDLTINDPEGKGKEDEHDNG